MSETQSHVIYVTSAEAVGHVDSRACAAAAAESTFLSAVIRIARCISMYIVVLQALLLSKPFRGYVNSNCTGKAFVDSQFVTNVEDLVDKSAALSITYFMTYFRRLCFSTVSIECYSSP